MRVKRAQAHAEAGFFRLKLVFLQPARAAAGAAQSGLCIIQVERDFRVRSKLKGMPGASQVFSAKVMRAEIDPRPAHRQKLHS